MANNELLTLFRSRLSDDERHLVEQRALGRSWNELSAELNEQPDALRKRLQRTISRVSAKLGMDIDL